MKKLFLSAALAITGLSAAAQSVDGLEYGAYYQKQEITAALGDAQESGQDPAHLTFRCGASSFSFDFSAQNADGAGRFVAVDILDAAHTVRFPLGEFKVGDSLKKLLYLRGDLEFLAFEDKLCRLSYIDMNGKKVSVMLEYDDDNIITHIRDLTIGGRKPDTGSRKGKFFNAIPITEVAGTSVRAGEPLERLLDLEVDVEFSPYGNGICRIWNDRMHEQYLVRYDLDHIIKEILLF